ncbi:YoaK family protein [Streptosporangium sp. NPDC051022]|uniref:YoaK family protein n=1 Tax=Streptosporangium sp. NPDC051022 TaxID=3155752 RepID=UPI00341AA969
MRPGRDTEGQPSEAMLMGLTFMSGMVDASSYLGIGEIFTANMTGNLLILGFAASGTPQFSIVASAISVVSFFLGAALGGRLTVVIASRRRRLVVAMTVESVLNALAAAGSFLLPTSSVAHQYVLVAILATSMGVRNTVVRRLKIPDITTTALTGTLTKLAADSVLGTGRRVRAGRRLTQIISLVLGACTGGLILGHFGLPATMVSMTGLIVVLTVAYVWYSAPARTDGKR